MNEEIISARIYKVIKSIAEDEGHLIGKEIQIKIIIELNENRINWEMKSIAAGPYYTNPTQKDSQENDGLEATENKDA